MDKEYIERESMLEEITAIMFGKPDIDLARAAVKYAPPPMWLRLGMGSGS